ncbi:putative disease resistance protein [Glycine soja]
MRMGELGKTTLAKLVFDNKEVYACFNCHLITKLRNGLRNKTYVVVFDDLWSRRFWNDIEFSLIDDKNGSRILITTRDTEVAQFSMKNSLIQLRVHKLEPLSEEKSLELLCKNAFGYGFDGCCPKEYEDVGLEIVGKCQCLPLVVFVIGSLLYSKCGSAAEWKRFSQNLSLGYDDLPRNLRSCLLYFGMYPKDYEVKSKRMIRQWIVEGSLVQESSFTIDDKVRACHVHESIHEMILGKIKDTEFCQYIDEHNQLVSNGILRRLTIATDSNDLIGSIERSHKERVLSENFISGILANYMPLKVLDIEFEYSGLSHVPENLGNLIHLKYLSLRYNKLFQNPLADKISSIAVRDLRGEHSNTLCSSINEMQLLKALVIMAEDGYGVNHLIDLHSVSSLSTLRKLVLQGKLTNDPLKSLKDMPNLLCSSLWNYMLMKVELYIFKWEGKHRLLDVVARSNSFEKSVVVALSGGGIVILDEVFEMRPLIQMERSASKLQVPII